MNMLKAIDHLLELGKDRGQEHTEAYKALESLKVSVVAGVSFDELPFEAQCAFQAILIMSLVEI